MERSEMDSQIWKRFPEDLIELVVSRLPFCAFLRFRSVSRKWKSLLGSPRFLQNLPLFLATYCLTDDYFSHGSAYEEISGALYEPLMKKWHYNLTFPSPTALNPACAAGGLVCYPDYTRHCFHVGNPITQTWKKLPWSPTATATLRGTGFDAFGMVSLNQDYSAKGYKIVWVSTRGKYEVYDSVKEIRFVRRVPDHIELPYALYLCPTLMIGTVVYFLSIDPDGIISYDVVSGKWEQFLIPNPARRDFPSLAECDGRMLLVGLVKNDDFDTVSVCVWELETKMRVWKEVDRMPKSLCSELKVGDWWSRCYGNNRLLVISLHMPLNNLIFTYDVVSSEWSEIRPFTAPAYRRTIRSGIGFFPSLLASPY